MKIGLSLATAALVAVLFSSLEAQDVQNLPSSEGLTMEDKADHVNSTSEPGGLVAFTVKLNITDSYPRHSGVLKFANVMINEGGAYSPDTGIFTCPLDGFYHFTIHISVYGLAECAIFKNGEKVVSLYHTNLPDKRSQVASVSSVVHLSKGDKVWVNLWGPGRNDIFATESNDTIFAGFHMG